MYVNAKQQLGKYSRLTSPIDDMIEHEKNSIHCMGSDLSLGNLNSKVQTQAHSSLLSVRSKFQENAPITANQSSAIEYIDEPSQFLDADNNHDEQAGF